jgi:hypothetical protein
MYADDTILKLKVQRDPDPETDEVFAYNQVRVVGESPVSHADKGNWKGEDARGVIIVPLANFGGTLDEPFGKIRTLYDVESIPEKVVNEAAPQVRVINSATAEAGPTPEDVFKEKAPGKAPEPGQKRGRTSPLGEPGGPADFDGPLGPADPATLQSRAEAEVTDTGAPVVSPLDPQ